MVLVEIMPACATSTGNDVAIMTAAITNAAMR